MMRFFSSLTAVDVSFRWSRQSHFFSAVGTPLLILLTTLSEYCRTQRKEFFTPSPGETVPRLVLLNLMLQTFDGVATYYGISLGVQEGNPLMQAAMVQWGVTETLLGTKGAACLTLPFFLFLPHRRFNVWALALLAGFYLALSFVPWLTILLAEAQQFLG